MERKGVFETTWIDGDSEPNRHVQIAASARRDEEKPKVDVLQSRLTRAAAAFARRRACRILLLAR